MAQLKMQISGMTCGHCVSAVQNALSTVHGVQVEQVAIGSATLNFDPSTTTVDQIKAAVEDEGYAVLTAH